MPDSPNGYLGIRLGVRVSTGRSAGKGEKLSAYVALNYDLVKHDPMGHFSMLKINPVSY